MSGLDYGTTRKAADAYMVKLENYVRLNVRRPVWMPMWVFKRLMRLIVIEESPLRVTLESLES